MSKFEVFFLVLFMVQIFCQNPNSYLWNLIYNPFPSLAATGCGGMYEARHDSGDSPQLEGLQTQQAPDTERSTHDRETRETAEARARKEA